VRDGDISFMGRQKQWDRKSWVYRALKCACQVVSIDLCNQIEIVKLLVGRSMMLMPLNMVFSRGNSCSLTVSGDVIFVG
jgi:hypothetical protein